MEQYKELEKKRDVPALKRPIEEIEEDEDPEIAMLEKILAEKKRQVVASKQTQQKKQIKKYHM